MSTNRRANLRHGFLGCALRCARSRGNRARCRRPSAVESPAAGSSVAGVAGRHARTSDLRASVLRADRAPDDRTRTALRHNEPMSIVVDQPAEHVLTIGINRPAARTLSTGLRRGRSPRSSGPSMPTPACTLPCCTVEGTFCAGADLKQIGSGNGNRVGSRHVAGRPDGTDTHAARQAGHCCRRGLRRRRRPGTGVVV